MDRRIRVGVVGVGSLGYAHARIFSELPEAELVGVFDTDARRAQEVAQKFGTRACASVAELLAQVEAASIVVPTHLHRLVAGQALEAGRHVLVEKPIAALMEEAEELVALARARGVILQVGHVERFNPVSAWLAENIRDPLLIEAHRLAPYPPAREGLHPRGTEVSVILDLMIHDLDIILNLVKSPVVDFHAVGMPVLSPGEDFASVRLLFANGCVANITASRISPERLRTIRVFTADRSVALDFQSQTGELCRKDGPGILREPVPIEKGEPLLLELRSFLECVRRGAAPVVSGAQAAETLRLAARIGRNLNRRPGPDGPARTGH